MLQALRLRVEAPGIPLSRESLRRFWSGWSRYLYQNAAPLSFSSKSYHHSIIWWIISYVRPTGDAMLNSWIHVFMYLYYLLAATITKDEKRRRKYLFWGKYLTMVQMIQFVSFIGQAVHGLIVPETYPKNMPRVSVDQFSSSFQL